MSAPDYEDWSAAVGTSVTLTAPGGRTAALDLTRCTDRVEFGDFATFTLTFTGGADAPTEQSTYNLTLDGHDPIDVFLVPVGAVDGAIEFEAVFTLRKE
jgi:hypothetical protein